MRYGSLFSGAGGLDLAIEEVFEAECAWQCEYDAAASKVLAAHWPDVPNLHDVTTIDWSTVEPVDIMCGGFPCQDVSSAGLRAGLATGTRSGLWARFADAIAAVRPRLVVIENVRGLLSADGEEWPPEVIAADAECARLARVVALIESKIRRAIHEGWWHGEYKQRKQFESHRLARLRDRALARFRTLKRRLVQRAIGTVVGDLANLGYDAQWTTVSAASVGAPHKRERVFILAADTTRVGRDARWAEPAGLEGRLDVAVGGDGDVADAEGCGRECINGGAGCAPACGGRERLPGGSAGGGASSVELLPTPTTSYSARSPEAWRRERLAGNGQVRNQIGDLEVAIKELDEVVVHLPPTPCASRSGNNQSDSAGAAVRPSLDSITELLPDAVSLLPAPASTTRWGKYESAVSRWERLTRPAPSPTAPNSKGKPRLAPPFPEWMQGWPDGWVTAVPGLSRNDQLRIIGNGVCPQQAEYALRQLIPLSEVAA